MSPEYSEHFLIDEQGRLCEDLPEVVEALLDYPDADFDIADYAMRNIGWIQISLNQPEGRIAAKFRSLTVSFGAISALYALLSNSDWKDIRFEYDLFGWMTEAYQDNGKACTALHVIVRSVIEFYYHPPYTSVEPGFPRWIIDLMTCFDDSAIRINAIPSALRATPMSPGG